jgi:hypothetical protein
MNSEHRKKGRYAILKRTNAPKLEVEIPTLKAKKMEKESEKNKSGS